MSRVHESLETWVGLANDNAMLHKWLSNNTRTCVSPYHLTDLAGNPSAEHWKLV